MAKTAISSAVEGAKDTLSPYGAGAILAMFLVFAVLAYFAITPSSLAADARERMGA